MHPDVLAQGHPFGFASKDQFQQAMKELQALFDKQSIQASLGVRGSSVTGFSHDTKSAFAKGKDIDVFVESAVFAGQKGSRGAPGMAYTGAVDKVAPGVRDWADSWSATLGHPVSVGGWATVPSGSTVMRPW
jgi:hypothetical protein